MMWPPSIIRLRVVAGGRRKVRLWLPLFLIWPVALVLALVLLPIIALVALIGWGAQGLRRSLLSVWYLWATLCSLRGLAVHVAGKGDEVLVSIR